MNEETAPPSPTPPVPPVTPVKRFAWQPFTFGGVAAFAGEKLGRLFLAQIVMAAIIAASFVWVLGHDYAPIVSKAVQSLTEEAVFKDGEIQGVPDRIVSESKFLSIAIETEPFFISCRYRRIVCKINTGTIINFLDQLNSIVII